MLRIVFRSSITCFFDPSNVPEGPNRYNPPPWIGSVKKPSDLQRVIDTPNRTLTNTRMSQDVMNRWTWDDPDCTQSNTRRAPNRPDLEPIIWGMSANLSVSGALWERVRPRSVSEWAMHEENEEAFNHGFPVRRREYAHLSEWSTTPTRAPAGEDFFSSAMQQREREIASAILDRLDAMKAHRLAHSLRQYYAASPARKKHLRELFYSEATLSLQQHFSASGMRVKRLVSTSVKGEFLRRKLPAGTTAHTVDLLRCAMLLLQEAHPVRGVVLGTLQKKLLRLERLILSSAPRNTKRRAARAFALPLRRGQGPFRPPVRHPRVAAALADKPFGPDVDDADRRMRGIAVPEGWFTVRRRRRSGRRRRRGNVTVTNETYPRERAPSGTSVLPSHLREGARQSTVERAVVTAAGTVQLLSHEIPSAGSIEGASEAAAQSSGLGANEASYPWFTSSVNTEEDVNSASNPDAVDVPIGPESFDLAQPDLPFEYEEGGQPGHLEHSNREGETPVTGIEALTALVTHIAALRVNQPAAAKIKSSAGWCIAALRGDFGPSGFAEALTIADGGIPVLRWVAAVTKLFYTNISGLTEDDWRIIEAHETGHRLHGDTLPAQVLTMASENLQNVAKSDANRHNLTVSDMYPTKWVRDGDSFDHTVLPDKELPEERQRELLQREMADQIRKNAPICLPEIAGNLVPHVLPAAWRVELSQC